MELTAIYSTDVTIFPCVSRVINDNTLTPLKAKLMSEENITNIIKSITDNQSYVIGYKNGVFKLILDGYYIELKASCEGTKYLQLAYNEESGDHILIQGDDGVSGGYFDGLSISDTKPSSGTYLCLCEGGQIPFDSYHKFNCNSMKFDFGELK